jgi:hypothetical protein
MSTERLPKAGKSGPYKLMAHRVISTVGPGRKRSGHQHGVDPCQQRFRFYFTSQQNPVGELLSFPSA